MARKQSLLAEMKREKKKREAESARVFETLWKIPEYVRLNEHLQRVIHRAVELDSVPSSMREKYPTIYPESDRVKAQAAVKRASKAVQDYEDTALAHARGAAPSWSEGTTETEFSKRWRAKGPQTPPEKTFGPEGARITRGRVTG